MIDVFKDNIVHNTSATIAVLFGSVVVGIRTMLEIDAVVGEGAVKAGTRAASSHFEQFMLEIKNSRNAEYTKF